MINLSFFNLISNLLHRRKCGQHHTFIFYLHKKKVSWDYEVEQEISIQQLDDIANQLETDVTTGLPDATDPYDFGKQIARMARSNCQEILLFYHAQNLI